MSEVQRHDDVGAVFRFLSHFLRMEVYQLRGDHRSHHLQQQKKESCGTRRSTRHDSVAVQAKLEPDPR
jgi:hypothetical protein